MQVEFALKVVAYGWQEYWADRWNKFDLFIIAVSTIDLAASFFESSLVSLLKVLRAQKLFRILRITRMFKVLKGLQGLANMAKAVYSSLGGMAQVGTLLLLVFFIYAYMGVLLFGSVVHGCVRYSSSSPECL